MLDFLPSFLSFSLCSFSFSILRLLSYGRSICVSSLYGIGIPRSATAKNETGPSPGVGGLTKLNSALMSIMPKVCKITQLLTRIDNRCPVPAARPWIYIPLNSTGLHFYEARKAGQRNLAIASTGFSGCLRLSACVYGYRRMWLLKCYHIRPSVCSIQWQISRRLLACWRELLTGSPTA